MKGSTISLTSFQSGSNRKTTAVCRGDLFDSRGCLRISSIDVAEVDGLATSTHEVYVAELVDQPGNIIALESIVFFDNFTTIMNRALRVHKVPRQHSCREFLQ